MGRVFTYAEIQRNEVPSADQFEQARDTALGYLESQIGSAIEGAFVYGSAAIDQANRRSDLDIFVALGPDYELGCRVVRATLLPIEQSLSTPVGQSVYLADDLRSGRHEIDRFFGQHLTGSDRVVIGQDPAEFMVFPEHSPHQILASYIAQKKRRFYRAYTSAYSPDGEQEDLQRMLELPAAVGRKALQAVHEVEAGSPLQLATANRQQVMKASEQLFKRFGIVGGFQQLDISNRLYNDVLARAMFDRCDQEDYEQFLNDLYRQLPKAINWLQQIERVILPKLI